MTFMTSVRRTAVLTAACVDEIPGLQGLHYSLWTGLFVPARLPLAAAQTVGKAANAVVASAAFRGWVEERGNTPGTVMDLEAAAQFYPRESDRFQKVAGDMGLERQ